MTHRIVIGVMMACAVYAAHAQDTTPQQNVQLQHQEIAKGDPARWYREDTTAPEQARTLRKEIGAALAEAKLACKRNPAAERAACLKQAQDTYQRDLANVPQVLAQNR
jgi:acyl-CoA reductase-like NAD-dependent aldehyde dehydrogenase